MNTNQFTQKTMEALQRAQQIAVEYQHMQVDEEHMLLSLTEDAKALIPQLLTRCGISVDAFRAALNDALSRIPRVSGPGREADKVYISPDFEKALLEAENRAKQMKDEYLSVEHVFLGIASKPNAHVKEILTRMGYDERKFLKELSAVRGVVKGKRVIVIDDSIVRGTTSKRIVQLLKEAGAAEVHMRISSPPLKYPCFYGIDISTTKELIAAKKSVEEIRDFIGADSLAFLSLDGLVESIGLGADAPYGGLCVAYFNGDYPTALDDYEADFLKSLTPEDRVRLPEFALYKSKYEGNEYTTTSPQEEH